MNYFKVLGITVGIISLLKPFILQFLPWDQKQFLKKTYSGKRPKWILYITIVALGILAYTWYRHFTSGENNSLLISILFTLSFSHTFVFIFNYKKFQEWVIRVIEDNEGQNLLWLDVYAGIYGLIMLMVSIWML
jgi:hypothetical protein